MLFPTKAISYVSTGKAIFIGLSVEIFLLILKCLLDIVTYVTKVSSSLFLDKTLKDTILSIFTNIEISESLETSISFKDSLYLALVSTNLTLYLPILNKVFKGVFPLGLASPST